MEKVTRNLVILIIIASVAAISTSYVLNISHVYPPPVNGSTQPTTTTDISLRVGEEINAGEWYVAHYAGNGVFFVSHVLRNNSIVWEIITWEVHASAYENIFLLGTKWYEFVKFPLYGGIVIKGAETL